MSFQRFLQEFNSLHAEYDLVARHALEMNEMDFAQALAIAYIPSELPSIEELRGGAQGKRLLRAYVDTLNDGALAGDKECLDFGTRLGRVFAAAIDARMAMPDPPMEFLPGNIIVDGESIEYDTADKLIVEYGLGFNGLVSHLHNLKAKQYTVAGICKDAAEVAFLSGLASYHEVELDSQLTLDYGLEACVNDMLNSSYAHHVDVVVASRVHMAGRSLRKCITKAPDLLHEGGILVARGPRESSIGIGYSAIAHHIRADSRLRVSRQQHTTRRTVNNTIQDNQLIVAHAA